MPSFVTLACNLRKSSNENCTSLSLSSSLSLSLPQYNLRFAQQNNVTRHVRKRVCAIDRYDMLSGVSFTAIITF